MNKATLFTTALTAVLLHFSGATMAATPSGEAPAPMRGQAPYMGAERSADSFPHMPYMHRGGMMAGGMMGTMSGCPMMGQLDGVNGKVMMQMHGEMMRAMGDILMKYADKLETPPTAQ